MRKLISRILSSAKKGVVTTGSWFKAGFLAAWRAVRATTRFTVNGAATVAVFVAAAVISAALLVLHGAVWALDTVAALLHKAITLATIAVMLPFLAFLGWKTFSMAVRSAWMVLRHWHVASLGEAVAATIVAPEEEAAPVKVEFEVTSVPAAARKGRPTPKQRKHRPARFVPGEHAAATA